MGIALSPDVRTLIDQPNFAHLAAICRMGRRRAHPVWVACEGDFLLIANEGGSLKAKNTWRDMRVSLSIVDFADPFFPAEPRTPLFNSCRNNS
jgi:Pyridoxamine 5'-phosphate oxidase